MAVPREVAAGSGAGGYAEAAGAEETSMTTGETAEAGDSTIPRPTLPAEKVAEQGMVAGNPSPAAMVAGRNAAEQNRKAEMDTLARSQLADWAVVRSMPTLSAAEAAATRTAMRCLLCVLRRGRGLVRRLGGVGRARRWRRRRRAGRERRWQAAQTAEVVRIVRTIWLSSARISALSGLRGRWRWVRRAARAVYRRRLWGRRRGRRGICRACAGAVSSVPQ